MRPLAVPASTLVAILALLAWAVPIVTAGGGCHPSGDTEPVAATGTSAVIEIDGCLFLPSIDRVAVGTLVTFRNASLTPHDVHGANYAWRSPNLEPGASFQYTFMEPGLHPYSCSLHPGMAGVIEVVTAADAAAQDVVPAAAIDEAPARDTSDSGSTGIDVLAAGGVGLVAGAAIAAAVQRRRRALG